MPHPDVIVVGGGVVGAACARALAGAGHSVTVLEAGPKRGAASLAAAGMLAPLAEAAAGDPMLGLSVRARDFYLEIVPELQEETGIDIGLWTSGIFQVAFTEEEAAYIRSEVAWQRQSGFTSEWLSAEEVRARVPGAAPELLGAAFAAEDGALRPLELLDALTKSATIRGAALVRGEEALELLVEEGRVTGLRTSLEERSTGAVVVAAGAWSGQLLGLPRPLTVEPIRGQLAALDLPPMEPRTVIYGGGGYLLQRRDEVIVGSTMEYVGFDDSVTEHGIRKIQQCASRICPAFEAAHIKRSWSGLRPQTPDGRPLIGRDPYVSGLCYATGHGRNGILLAGLTGELVAQLHSDKPPEQDLSCVEPGRFWSW